MSSRTGLITPICCVLMCVVLVCQTQEPVDNTLMSKILAVLGKHHRASGASSASKPANRIQPGLPSSKTKVKATSGGNKSIRSINSEFSGTTLKTGTTTGTTMASPTSSTTVKPKPLDTQNVDINININNNINSQEPVTSATAKPTTRAVLSDACVYICSFSPSKLCGCASNNAWS